MREQDKRRNIESPEDTKLGLRKIDELADTAIKLEANGLAELSIVEGSIVHSLSVLHRLSYEDQKIKSGLLPERK
jgi:hypothetical protein